MQTTKIYIISLKRLPDRRKGMEAQLAKLGLEAEFVEAVDGLELSKATIKANYAAQAGKSVTSIKMSSTEIACAWSHRNAYKRLIDSEEKYALVLEDDAILSPEIVQFLEYVPKIASDWELIHLYWRPRSNASSFIFRSRFPLNLYNQHKLELGPSSREYRLGEVLLPVTSAVAYMVSRQGAQMLTHYNTPITVLSDHVFSNATPGKWLAVKPGHPGLVNHKMLAYAKGITVRSLYNPLNPPPHDWVLRRRFFKYSLLQPGYSLDNKRNRFLRRYLVPIVMTILYLTTGFSIRRR